MEETAFIRIGEHTVRAIAEQYQDRTAAEGKVSFVQFVLFRFAQNGLRHLSGLAQVVLGLHHPAYGHMAVIPDAVRTELSRDFD